MVEDLYTHLLALTQMKQEEEIKLTQAQELLQLTRYEIFSEERVLVDDLKGIETLMNDLQFKIIPRHNLTLLLLSRGIERVKKQIKQKEQTNVCN